MAKSKNTKKVKQKQANAPQVPAGPNNDVYRSIRFKSDIKTLVVRTELGYDMVFELNPQIRVNPYEGSENGTPKFQSSIIWNLKGVRPRGSTLKQNEIQSMITERSVLPMEMDWDICQLGFVYSNARDPNNHRWWLETLKSGQKMGEFTSQLSEYLLQVTSTAPIGSRSWFDGIHHGRFTFAKDYIKDAKEIGKGHVFIEGNGKGRIGDIKGNVDIPENAYIVRLRFDIRKNHWYIEFVDHTGAQIGDSIISTNIKADAKFKGHILADPNRPKVSGMILVEDVIAIKTDPQLTMIKGKV
jgi:hypothetical protein